MFLYRCVARERRKKNNEHFIRTAGPKRNRTVLLVKVGMSTRPNILEVCALAGSATCVNRAFTGVLVVETSAALSSVTRLTMFHVSERVS